LEEGNNSANITKLMSISTIRIMLVLATVVVAIIVVVPKRVKAVRAFFVFGDSLVDSGNNNYLPTISTN